MAAVEKDSGLEHHYRQKLLALFALVDARQPEKGIAVLFQRAKLACQKQAITYHDALEAEYQGARQRTEARLALLGRCTLPDQRG